MTNFSGIRIKKLFQWIFILLIVLSVSFPVNAQTSNPISYPVKPNKDYFLSYWTALKGTATAPVHWKKKQWITFGSVVAGGVILYSVDKPLHNFFQSHKTTGLNKISKYGFEPWGSGYYTLPFLGGYYLLGVTSHNDKARRVALAGTQAFVMGVVAVEVVKHIFGRERPFQTNPPNPNLWEGPLKFQYDAFPSGHTTVAFSVATVFAYAYKNKPWVGIISYGIATGVALSRVYDNKHWSSDVFIGAALGYAVGKTVYHLMEGNKHISMGITQSGNMGLAYNF